MAKRTLSVQWRCPACLTVNEIAGQEKPEGPWPCSRCGAERTAQPGAWDADGHLGGCPVCGCRDLYRQRDFNRRLGLAVIIVGAALAPWTKFLSLVAAAGLDWFLYRWVGEVVVCYHCQAILRGLAGVERVPPFDLNVSDKYIEIERRRGW